jgi:putative SOS response-associated peptidase YedK
MCYSFYSSNKWLKDLSVDELYAPSVEQINLFPDEEYNVGFVFPRLQVLTNNAEKPIQEMEWGLLPSWTRDRTLQKNTLNARLETLKEKASFRSYVNNRCLIPADSFVEWQWLDPKGKVKQKYRIRVKGEPWFTFAGIYSNWADPEIGEIIPTFTIITREAEGIMREIHNTKLRMPMIVSRSERDAWLACELDVATPPELEAEKIE